MGASGVDAAISFRYLQGMQARGTPFPSSLWPKIAISVAMILTRAAAAFFMARS